MAIVPRDGGGIIAIVERNDANASQRRPAHLAQRDRKKDAKTATPCPKNAVQIVSPPCFILLFILTYKLHLDCCARRLLSLQPDFMTQRSAIEETVEPQSHTVLFFPKLHCELNHIEYFRSQANLRYARENCNYKIEGLRDTVPASLAHVASSTILGCYSSCLKKMQL
jgi:hypothetical protein